MIGRTQGFGFPGPEGQEPGKIAGAQITDICRAEFRTRAFIYG